MRRMKENILIPFREVAQAVLGPLASAGVIVEDSAVFADDAYVSATDATITKNNVTGRWCVGHGPSFFLQSGLQRVTFHLGDARYTSLSQGGTDRSGATKIATAGTVIGFTPELSTYVGLSGGHDFFGGGAGNVGIVSELTGVALVVGVIARTRGVAASAAGTLTGTVTGVVSTR